MVNIIRGDLISQDIKNDIRKEIEHIKSKGKRAPFLSIILVGNNPASLSYIKGKENASANVGIESKVIKLDENISQEDLIDVVKNLNEDKNIDGILIQLPLPMHLNENEIINHIDYRKDVDGLTYTNIGKLYLKEEGLFPCTPLGIVELLDRNNIEVKGKSVVVLGRSKLVGNPIAKMLLDKDATVIICHSKTNNLKEVCKMADILIVAIGKEKFINSEYVKNKSVIIDVGINKTKDNKLVGDVDFDDVINSVSYITPVPKGVGPMTIAMLLKNTLKAYKMREKL